MTNFILLLFYSFLILIPYCKNNSQSLFDQAEKFKLLDINKDGVITMSDLEKAFGDELSYDEADKFFEVYDLNQDGMITVAEYLNKWNELNKEVKQ